MVDGVDNAPGVFTFHAFCCNRDLNRARSRKIGSHLQSPVTVLGRGNVVIKAILVEISAEIAVHTRKQPVTCGFIIISYQHTETDYVIDGGEILQRCAVAACHALQLIPSLPISIDCEADRAIHALGFHQVTKFVEVVVDEVDV